ncbi:ribosome-associated ATPase/putative transporter RbbA [Eikenella sp. S3360]|uniref:Ribosome-associated ATPase/putative transporter RbbA n=1 Tax=Eikenella glucosivorans TaxID=2766967 RepID=A0ABS0N9K6_9NEIS|nr:ribosome-associated ATPase/putative transporter RbbA [Eikenella glucosivorans]MBH5328976.1 ribosome-associated ATPase/putative transporter RbbA [Eikenella glucosivorans]
MQNAIELSSVSHAYRKRQALKGVSLAIESGSTVGLIGPDGVGKSTLLSLIAGVRTIQSGEVRVLGHNLAHKAEREEMLPHIAFMPQGLGKNLYPTLSVYENIDFHARLFGLNKQQRQQRIARLMQSTGLAPFASRAAGKLSGGMKQKLSLCCALVHNPKLLILDEPTTGVDPLSRRQFWELVRELRAENPGMTVLVATAYIDEAEQFEQLLAMDDGNILVNGRTQAILAQSGCTTLEQAYIRLLPENKQTHWDDSQLPPFIPDDSLPPAIEAENLSKRFGDFTAVDKVSFRIRQGEIFGFLGSNGCGKSTTMKMLTGLLDASEGEATLLGEPIDAGSAAVRQRVGYMSQAFSLYEELSVRQNLVLHAQLYQLGSKSEAAIAAVLQQFELADLADAIPAALPLGVRQRLQLAAACLHRPQVLILDEPTSGVDPAARDMFWQYLFRMAREERVTIFVSTHFMNEAARCDRISLMHRGRVLAVGAPDELRRRQHADTLEEAFIRYLEQDEAAEQQRLPENEHSEFRQNERSEFRQNERSEFRQNERLPEKSEEASAAPTAQARLPENEHSEFRQNERSEFLHSKNERSEFLHSKNERSAFLHSKTPAAHSGLRYWLAAVFTFTRREGKELLRDRIRLMFALIGPLVYLLAGSLGVSFDVNEMDFAVLDQDQSRYSRELAQQFDGSAYFRQTASLGSRADIDTTLTAGRARMVMEIPPGFGKDLMLQRRPQLAFYVDGSWPFVGENIIGYAQGILSQYGTELYRQHGIRPAAPTEVQTRFIYNPTFKSINALTPGFLMLSLMMIPAMLTALSVVREKEIGSIMNLYSSPASPFQYLLGKQLPYVLLSLLSYLILLGVVVFGLGVPLKGSFAALTAGVLCFVLASTGFGLLVSTFVRTQVAAIFAAAILAMIPAMNFSGMLYPTSTLNGTGYWMGQLFPSSWFQTISLGTITKGLGWRDVDTLCGMLLLFFAVYWLAAGLLLKKQEK